MKVFVVFFLAIATTHAFSDREEWIKFKISNNKIYKNYTEDMRRYSIFQSNLHTIEKHNEEYSKGFSTFQLGINKYADLTAEEFLERLKLSKLTKPTYQRVVENIEYLHDIPDEIDWSKKGAVTKVKDQGSCGSCWTFSTTGTVESANFIKSGNLISLSEQNLVDCAKDNCYGCSGGWMDKALEYIEENGIMTEQAYPYEGIEDKCRFNKSESVVKVNKHVFVKSFDEDDLKKATAGQPVSVAVSVTALFRFYKSGVLNDSTCEKDLMSLNHGVLVVGYGSVNGTDYWIVKNSWGEDWGMNGYLWMSRNMNNQCGIATDAVYPIL